MVGRTRSHRLAANPGGLGADRVLVASQNCPQFVIAFYAMLRAGAVVVPVNPMSKAAGAALLRRRTAARASPSWRRTCWRTVEPGVVDAHRSCTRTAMRGADAGGRGAGLGARRAGARRRGPALRSRSHRAQALALDPQPLAPDDLAVLPYTSGTTGHPKGCMHTHAHGAGVAGGLAGLEGAARARSVVLAVAPLFHMLGLQNGMNMPIFLGGTAVMLPRWNPAVAARLIERHRVTAWTAPPAMILDLFSHRGGAAARPLQPHAAVRRRRGDARSGGGHAVSSATASPTTRATA